MLHLCADHSKAQTAQSITTDICSPKIKVKDVVLQASPVTMHACYHVGLVQSVHVDQACADCIALTHDCVLSVLPV